MFISEFTHNYVFNTRGGTNDYCKLFVKKDEDTFVCKINYPEPLYGVVTKLTDKNYDFWSERSNAWYNYLTNDNKNTEGVGHFKDSILTFKYIKEEGDQIWIAYLTNEDPLSLNYKIDFAKNIIITVSIQTNEKSLVTSHMGVQRTPHYSTTKSNEYKGVSMFFAWSRGGSNVMFKSGKTISN